MVAGSKGSNPIIQPIAGNTIHLRDICLNDLEAVAYWHLPGHRWQELDAPYAQPMTPEAVDEWIAKLRERIERRDFQSPRTRLVIADGMSDQYIGDVSRYWTKRELSWACVGIGIHDDAYWGRGIGFEALGLWCDYLLQAFPEWVRLGCETWSGNLGMVRLALKLGMQEEARYRLAYPNRGQHFDSVAYGILRTEWAARYPRGFAPAINTS